MKKKILILLLLVLLLVGCNKKEGEKETMKNSEPTKVETKTEYKESVKIKIDNKEYTLNLLDNATAKKLKEMLPLEMEMEELNGNEKYIFLAEEFPTNQESPKHIEAGDVMLYGTSCIVIFYQSFDTTYEYTRIGHIDNLGDLGKGSVKVKISE